MRTNNNKGRRPAGGTGNKKSGFSGGRDKKGFKSDRREERGENDNRSQSKPSFSERKKGADDRKSGSRSFNNRDEKPKRFDKEGRSFSKDREGFKGNDEKPRNFKREGSSFSKDRDGLKGNDEKPRNFKREGSSFSKDRDGFKSNDGKSKNFKRADKPFSKDKGDFKERSDKRKFSRDGNSFSKEKRNFEDKNDKQKRYKKEGQSVDNPNYFKNKERSNSEQWNDGDFERSKKSKSEKTFKPARENRDGEKKSIDDNQDENNQIDNRNNKRKEFIERREKIREEESDNRKKRKRSDKPTKEKNENGETLIRLNKFIANSGVCSRREADKLIESGAVTVNGKIVSELGYKVNPTDVVNYGGANIKREKNVYVLLNKPKDYITTLDDPEGRKTVMELVRSACKERIYPVGRLDRNTTGLLLFTNDGDMTMKLTHPKNNIQKLYGIEIDKSIRPEDFKAILDGIELEDGFIKADKLEFVGGSTNRKELGIEIHSGRNRIVRRIFEHLGYKVVKLDRVMFAGLTKKDLPRGKWRFLTEKEIGYLRMKK